MIREQVMKRLASPSRTQLHADNKLPKVISRKRETLSEGLNNVVTSFDALKLTFEEEDSEIEISGPFPIPLKPESSKTVPKTRLKDKHANAKPVHPFFRRHIPHKSNSYDSRSFTFKASPPPSSEVSLKTASVYSIATSPSAVSKKLDSVNTFATSNLVPETPAVTPTSAQFNQFLVYSYKHYKPIPTVVYTQHEEEANDLIGGLKAGPIALDLEWRLFFTRQYDAPSWTLLKRRAAVVQVADSSGLILIIQVYNMSRFPIKLQSLLENHEIPKIGVNIRNDGTKLFQDYGILTRNLVELGALALLADKAGSQERSGSRKIVSLAKLVQWYCGMQLEKGDERTSNWEAKLDQRQIDYAANDVHSSMVVYQKICSIAQFNAITLTDKRSVFTSDVEWPTSEKSQYCCQSGQSNISAHGQQIRAYQFWHHEKMTLDNMCMKLSLKNERYHQQEEMNLKPGTVISYIIGALQANPSLPYLLPQLIQLVQMDAGSWTRHREWIIYVWNQNLVKV